MKKFTNYLLILILATTVLFSCTESKKNNSTSGPATDVTGDITSNTTWRKGVRYVLKGTVSVKSGAVLTIEPGAVIRGDKATTGTLVIERGGQIIADGRANDPIIFTSNKDAGDRTYGDWGGIVILGNAPVNVTNPEIEGVAGKIYGGSNAADNSGILRFVRIEFGGVPITPGNEINGLTMGGVGSGTTIENVQVSFSGDDAFEWFGGTVNARNLVSHRNWDDDFDTDLGYVGKVQFGIALRDPFIADQSQSNCFECDNDASGSSNVPISNPTFSNITCVGNNSRLRNGAVITSGLNANYGRALHIRRNTSIGVFNSLFYGWGNATIGGLDLDGTGVQNKFESLGSGALQIQFRGNVFAGETTAGAPNTIRFGAAAASATATTDFNANNTDLGTATGTLPDAIRAFERLINPALTVTDAALTSGAVFTGRLAGDGFFQSVTHRGAFGATDWTTGWANFDPVNAVY
ncbi:MAG TPA: hypothetical protein DCM08_06225 [Microscillaceae bacterium]|nr:hypothetical protein [Microscillaceae bacterium]